MKSRFDRLLLLLLLFLPAVEVAASDAGKLIFDRGLHASGDPVTAVIQGDIPVSGTQLACVSCHRRSRLGSTEGHIQVPPLDYDSLFNPQVLSINEQRGVSQQGASETSVYNDTLLARAIVDGIDKDGRAMDPVMPRYQLSTQSIASLIAYIKTFKAESDPAVSDTDLHIATVVTDPESPAAKVMLAVLEDFFEDKNANTRLEKKRSKHTPWTREWWYKSYRTIVLHRWTLSGEPESWSSQLQDYYRDQPVFTLVSGLAQDWHPIEEFCESNKIPCLLPNVIQPPNGEGYYSRYFSPGLLMEASVLGNYLNKLGLANTTQQLISHSALARAAAVQLDEALNTTSKLSPLSLDEYINTGLPAQADGRIDTVVYWGDVKDLGDLVLARLHDDNIRRICYSATLNEGSGGGVYQGWSDETCIVSPYRVGKHRSDDIRTLVWLKRKGLAGADNRRLKFDTYYAAKLVADTITAIRGNFSRDYFLEKIEHMVDKSLVKPDFAHLSAGPGQRYFSRGAYVLVSEGGHVEPEIGNDWYIPDFE